MTVRISTQSMTQLVRQITDKQLASNSQIGDNLWFLSSNRSEKCGENSAELGWVHTTWILGKSPCVYGQPGLVTVLRIFHGFRGNVVCLWLSQDKWSAGFNHRSEPLYASTAPPMEVLLPFSTHSLLLTVVSSRYHPIFNLCEKAARHDKT